MGFQGRKVASVSYHDTVNVLQGRDWSAAGPFARPEWFTLLETHGARPLLAEAQDSSGTLALPLVRKGPMLESLTNWYAFTWQPLATPGADLPTLAAALARGLKGDCRQVTLGKLPGDIAGPLCDAFASAGWYAALEPCDTNHCLGVLGRDFATCLAARPGPLRTTLKRKAKKVEVELLDTFQHDAWSAYEAVYAESWKPEEGDPALLRAFAEAEGAAGRLRMGLARHEGAVVAAQFWTVERGTAYIHKLAHLESAKPLSPGTTLSAALFERVIDGDRVSRIDFGTGDDPYKRDWMERVRVRWRLVAWRPEVPANWPRIARHALRRLVAPALVSRPSAG